jgi:hypothetical protein
MQFDPPIRIKGEIYVALRKKEVDGKVSVQVIGVFDNVHDAQIVGTEVQGPFFVRRRQPQPRHSPIIFPKNYKDF